MPVLKTSLRPLLIASLFLILSTESRSQVGDFEHMVFLTDSLNSFAPRETLFIHRDKPVYQPGDTIWFKGYIVSAPEHLPNDSSRFAYVEIINAQQQVVKRMSIPCIMGLFAGRIILGRRDFIQGEYILRGYTRYMRNFGDSLFFESRLPIVDPRSEQWQTTIQHLSFEQDRLILSAKLQAQAGQSIAGRAVTIRLRSKNRIVYRARLLSDAAGIIRVDTLLGNTTDKDLNLEIADQSDVKVKLPVRANEKKLIDLQFLPEGGTFVAGKRQALGFKAVNIAGKGVDVSGVIKDSKGNTLTAFNSIHKGMGIVAFSPQLNERYEAVLESGTSYALPPSTVSGVVLQVEQLPGVDSIRMRIDATRDLFGQTISFTASSRGIIAIRGKLLLTSRKFELSVHKNQFRSGVSLFTLYDDKLQPINQRAVFVWHGEDLKLNITTQKPTYSKKDSVSLHLTVVDNKGERIAGAFSISVVDTAQVKLSPNAENLLTYMLLGSDLRGEIEEPYYYFNEPAPGAIEALMLTQGWVSYNRRPVPVDFSYEEEFIISGKVTNILNKPIINSNVVLLGKAGRDHAFFMDTVTDKKGEFVFNGFDFYENDSVRILIKALNKNKKAFNVGVDINYPDYPGAATVLRTQGTDDIFIDPIVKEQIARQKKFNEEFAKDGITLEEVVVTSKFRVPGSKNLNEDGGSDQLITEETLNKTPKETLRSMLFKHVQGFHIGSPPKSTRIFYKVRSNLVRLVIDGVDMHFFFQSLTGLDNEYVTYLDTYLNLFTADQIKGIEIMSSPVYNGAYRTSYLSLQEQIATGPATIDFAFIEITTQTGEGPFAKQTPGMYLLSPLYPVLTKQFYSPKYRSPEQENIFPDLRKTIYWDPGIITNEKGEATVSFYTSEGNSSNYVVIVQGTDLKGRFGVLVQPLEARKELELK